MAQPCAIDTYCDVAVGGKRQYVVKGTTFDVDERYEVKKGVGQGAYGLICAAQDTVTGEQVAIKKISNAFEDATDCKRMLREMRLLQHFQHENILSIRDIMLPPPGKLSDWKDVYLVTELLDTDLHYIIHSKQPLSDDHIQYFVYQAMRTSSSCPCKSNRIPFALCRISSSTSECSKLVPCPRRSCAV